MKILIADDATANMEAAKQAAAHFPEHEFIFTNSASEAFELLPSVDGVITDLFFKEDLTNSLIEVYETYTKMVQQSPMFSEVIEQMYQGDRLRAEQKLENVLYFLTKGTTKSVKSSAVSTRTISDLINSVGDPVEVQYIDENSAVAPEFPFGGLLMLKAKELGKFHCLVSNIHRHAGSYSDTASSLDAMVLLMPLMEKDVVTPKQTLFDGEDSLTYIGGDEINKIVKTNGDYPDGTGKEHSYVWIEGIRRVLAQ